MEIIVFTTTMLALVGKKSGQFESKSDWNNYLEHFSKCLKNPLQVSIIEQNKEL